MANLRSSSDLKKLALQHAGELTDGTSPYDLMAMVYLSSAHNSLIAGGNEFGIDVSEPWVWAKAKHPIVFSLQTAFTDGAVTLTYGSFNGTFSVAPSLSMEGRYLKTSVNDDFYVIRKHVAGETGFQLDKEWVGNAGSGAYGFTAIQLEYDLYDDNIVVDNYNNIFEWQDNSGDQSYTMPVGVYNPSEFISAFNLDTGLVLSYNSLTRKFKVSHGGPLFSLKIATAADPELSGWTQLGFDVVDKSGSLEYASDNVYQAIQRLIMAFNCYRNTSPRYQAPEDTGKIYGVEMSTLLKKWPLAQIYPFVPDTFAVVRWNENGSVRVRFNTYNLTEMRVEAEYIPIPMDLKDNDASIPLVPRAFREYLVYATAYRLMMDKSDNRAETYANLAKLKLQALINDNRSNKELTNNKYGRLVPRGAPVRPWRVIP